MKLNMKKWMLVGCIAAAGIWFAMQPYSGQIKHRINKLVADGVHTVTGQNVLASGTLEAQAAVVMNQDTGEVLYGMNDNQRLEPASTTKIMTALLAIEMADMNEQVTVGKEVLLANPGESSAGLRLGELLSWRDLLEAMMLPSGNDAARTIAVQLGRQLQSNPSLQEEEAIRVFVQRMNERAEELDLRNTHFMNPHGLHHANHYSSAHDLAVIAKEAMKSKLFRSIVGQTSADVKLVNSDMEELMKSYTNRNRLLQQGSEYYYEGSTGIKTGFTDEAGYCLVSAAEREGHRIITVVLHSGSNSVWTDARELLDYGFAQYAG
ncbi:D-alanyl-D-alanine carboxypeptidase [Paenibacillus alvei]|uniref:D-alanyl-D-alanine carboxypeptidase n=1 Tax=Paenibacillus alvei TaxID=44250 RepID=A0ABT4GWS8_PAEAL|nr:D-alanyl-D-alanine carboxypeptidase family protein [Paenibacillus alvei]MCY9761163.1 D-alanyl-D-alanine carboxypeptidase [Paenibacillus alvei]MCY9765793.1 D-alanyl-D-alanine carboxypeptidase [Paenibacillus alvei]